MVLPAPALARPGRARGAMQPRAELRTTELKKLRVRSSVVGPVKLFRLHHTACDFMGIYKTGSNRCKRERGSQGNMSKYARSKAKQRWEGLRVVSALGLPPCPVLPIPLRGLWLPCGGLGAAGRDGKAGWGTRRRAPVSCCPRADSFRDYCCTGEENFLPRLQPLLLLVSLHPC